MSVRNKTILITGSTDGVGQVVAERLAAEGANVIVHGRDKARGDSLVEGIAKRGGKSALPSS
jgi:NAD(P)-dependent dehydrogenase (short-subunit alcohol dehydrogenase family)